MDARQDARIAGCVLEGRAPCPSACAAGGRCAVVRIQQRDSTERLGVPLGLVGETLRFLQVLPAPAVLLLALDGLEPESRESVLFRLPADARERS